MLGRPVGTSLSRGWGRPWSCCSLEEVTLPHGWDLLGVPGAGARQGSLSSPCVGPGDLECPWGCLFLPIPCVPDPRRRACSLSQGLGVPAEPLPLWACPAARSSPSCTTVRNLEPPDLEARPQGPGSTFYELLPPSTACGPAWKTELTDPASWVAGGFKSQRKLQAPKGGHGCRADIQPSFKSVKSHQGPECCKRRAGAGQGGETESESESAGLWTTPHPRLPSLVPMLLDDSADASRQSPSPPTTRPQTPDPPCPWHYLDEAAERARPLFPTGRIQAPPQGRDAGGSASAPRTLLCLPLWGRTSVRGVGTPRLPSPRPASRPTLLPQRWARREPCADTWPASLDAGRSGGSAPFPPHAPQTPLGAGAHSPSRWLTWPCWTAGR